MDVENKHLDLLLSKTDIAYQRLLENPDSSELTHAYEDAKAELDGYLTDMRNALKKRYKDF